jgi:hypothetical protein
MAEIRVDRTGGSRAWVWIVAAVLVVAAVIAVLHFTGYIDLTRIGATGPAASHSLALLVPAALAAEG